MEAAGWYAPYLTGKLVELWHYEYGTYAWHRHKKDLVSSGSVTAGKHGQSTYNGEYDNQLRNVFGEKYQIARAIMLAESTGDASAVNYNPPYKSHPGSWDYGLFQINSIHFTGKHAVPGDTVAAKKAWLLDPAKNIQYAGYMSGGGVNWLSWVSYTTGKYQKFMQ
jgi:hypothetical protein